MTLLLAEAPGAAQPLIEAHQQAREGDVVIVTGLVGGPTHPFVSGRAVMTVADRSLKTCVEACSGGAY
jgi:hypothetical protein